MRKFIYLCLSAVFSACIASCDFDSEGVFTDETTEECYLYDYYIDQYGNEGIVAYIYSASNSDRKKVLVISADEARLPWGPMGETIFKPDSIKNTDLKSDSYSIGMHQLMHSIGIGKFPAQAWCDAKNGGESHPRAGSWHLPSKEEYSEIFGSKGANLNSLNAAISGIGGTPVTVDEFYWTCCEDYTGYITISGQETDYDPANRAVILTPDFKSTAIKNRWLKKNSYNVRAVKYVYYNY